MLLFEAQKELSGLGSRDDAAAILHCLIALFVEAQKELSGLVLPLAPDQARLVPKSIPFMTAGEGVGRRTRVAAAQSSLSGPIVVEDVTIREDTADKVPLCGIACALLVRSQSHSQTSMCAYPKGGCIPYANRSLGDTLTARRQFRW